MTVTVSFFLATPRLYAQASAPGRPLTPDEQNKLAPSKPVIDTVAPKEPPSPSKPGNPFPKNPDKPLTNPRRDDKKDLNPKNDPDVKRGIQKTYDDIQKKRDKQEKDK